MADKETEMRNSSARHRAEGEHRVPRIDEKTAERIIGQLEQWMESADDVAENLNKAGFSPFLAQFEESALKLAIQPDESGEEARARLVAVIMYGLKGIRAESASVEDIAAASNILMPCFLLELGRRSQHIEVKFPRNPFLSDARIQLSVGPSYPTHALTSERIARLVAELGEELIGLCHFGNALSRERIEIDLCRDSAADS